MPPILVHEDPDDVVEIADGVTCASRVAKLAPGETVPVLVIGQYRRSRSGSPPRERLAMNGHRASAEVFSALKDLSELVPEMRSGQLMAAVGELCVDLHGRGLWDCSDDELLEAAWMFRRNLEKVLQAERSDT